MPDAIGKNWRRSRAKLDITSDQAAKLLGIAGGALRSIELEIKPASLALAFRAARLYSCSVDDLLRDDDEDDKTKPKKDKPAEPKVEPVAPPRRRNGKHNERGPKRSAAARQAS